MLIRELAQQRISEFADKSLTVEAIDRHVRFSTLK
jgi:hypothetical protein